MAEYIFWVIVVIDAIAFAAALLAYGALGDWGAVTTDQLPVDSTRLKALIVAGTYTLWVGCLGVIAVMAYALLTVRLRRRFRAQVGTGFRGSLSGHPPLERTPETSFLGVQYNF